MAKFTSECRACTSANLQLLDSEINIQVPRLKYFDKFPGYFVFPKLVVCLDCGFVEANFSDPELRQLREQLVEIGGHTGSSSA
jgi:hypothetical protein